MTEQKQILEKKLWAIANTLRGNMGADEFRDYILGFIFYKFLSEKIQLFIDAELANDNKTFDEAMEDPELAKPLEDYCVETLGYFIKPGYLFHNLAERARHNQMVIEDLAKAFKYIEEATDGHQSQDGFMGLFADVDLNSSKLGKTVEKKDKLIAEVIKHIDEVDFKFSDTEADVLGDAYEYLIGQFASGAGKKAGEFYTPQQVSLIMAKIVSMGKTQLKSVYDPTCGSGSLLLRVSKQCRVADFYGQELNTTTYNLARMNMILHEVRFTDFHLEQGDTLEEPHHLEQRFEAVVANPPFSAQWSAHETFLSDERFSDYGKLAPKSKADFAFVQHMIHQLADDGVMSIVLPHGVLFRGAAEGVIRKYLIKERNYLDAVIGLPANIFFGTGIPTAILVFRKNRNPNDKILFIDASQGFEKAKNQNVLRPTDIDKIITTYQARTGLEKYSYLATRAELEENDYNLNIPRYVDTFEEEEPIDLNEVVQQLNKIEINMQNTDAELQKFCAELRIDLPGTGAKE